MIQFVNVINQKQKNQNNESINDEVLLNGCKIEDIGLTFTMPGYFDIELKRGGSEIMLTDSNIEEYVGLVFSQLCLQGPKDYIEGFKQGFNKVFDITNLKSFTSLELEEIICGCNSEPWDIETLKANIIPNHGLDKKSRVFNDLLDIMSELSNFEKKKLLLFVTGSPRLPLGGIYY